MKKQIRCAIYTRKSTEEGLEQDFNSLDAQREACEAYIKSQMHEGWVLLDKQYNDGGYSGGTMERPAFKELLKDIENDEVNIVVVYKVDRLTRSLMDFSKIIDVFDKHNASFVSITQHFNTTTSMGRLTLNILLSFAQFEREVTGERIRDKFEASRKKGLWLSGTCPYGYIKDDHHMLHPDPPYSDNVRIIFESYLEIKNVLKLKKYLAEQKILTRTGKELAKGSLYHILSNKVYLGKIVHKNKEYDGLHEPIISEELFNDVQNLLKANYDMKLIQAIVKSFWYNKLGAEKKLPIEARNGNNKRLRKLRFLPPEIIENIMNGTQDPELNVKKLIEMAEKCCK